MSRYIKISSETFLRSNYSRKKDRASHVIARLTSHIFRFISAQRPRMHYECEFLWFFKDPPFLLPPVWRISRRKYIGRKIRRMTSTGRIRSAKIRKTHDVLHVSTLLSHATQCCIRWLKLLLQQRRRRSSERKKNKRIRRKQRLPRNSVCRTCHLLVISICTPAYMPGAWAKLRHKPLPSCVSLYSYTYVDTQSSLVSHSSSSSTKDDIREMQPERLAR